MRRDWERRYPAPRDEKTWTQYAKIVFRQVEKWMDAGYGKCWLRDKSCAAELQRSLLHYLDSIQLEEEIGAIKRVTARFINQRERNGGALWQQEAYDRIIRDEEHLYKVVQYVGANPERAGIPKNDWRRWVNPEWQVQGWDFER